MSSALSSDIYNLAKLAKELEQRFSSTGIPIPEKLQTQIAELNQDIKAFLQASQEESDSKERDNSLEQMLLFVWRTFFNNVLQKIDDYYRDNFELYNTMLFNEKDYGKTVVATDKRHKIQAIHEMLIKTWPHMIPPRIEDINFPESNLVNDMIYGYPEEYGIEKIEPAYGFVEPPSLNPDARPLSIEEYLATEYKIDDDCIENRTVINFADFAREPDIKYDPSEHDPTFLLDVVKKHGSKGYRDVYQMFPHWLSDYHPRQ
jgi:hypothetical protein